MLHVAHCYECLMPIKMMYAVTYVNINAQAFTPLNDMLFPILITILKQNNAMNVNLQTSGPAMVW